MDRNELLRFAQVGAQARLIALQAEMQAILKQFPSLRGPKGRRQSEVARPRRRPRRRGMSAAQRKAVSLRMKKYWAARRARQ